MARRIQDAATRLTPTTIEEARAATALVEAQRTDPKVLAARAARIAGDYRSLAAEAAQVLKDCEHLGVADWFALRQQLTRADKAYGHLERILAEAAR